MRGFVVYGMARSDCVKGRNVFRRTIQHGQCLNQQPKGVTSKLDIENINEGLPSLRLSPALLINQTQHGTALHQQLRDNNQRINCQRSRDHMQQIHILGAEREPRGYYTPFTFACLDTASVPPVRGKRTNTPVQCPPFSSHRGTQHITSSHVSSMLSPVYMKRTAYQC